MTLILFTVFAGMTCSAVSPLLEDFYANFGGDPIIDDSPHDWIMRQVIYRNGVSCGTVPDRTTQRAAGVSNLKLHHKQMHYRQSSSFKEFKVKTTMKVVTNMLAEHQKLMLYSLKTLLGGVNLVGLSL